MIERVTFTSRNAAVKLMNFGAACSVRGRSAAMPFHGIPPAPDWSHQPLTERGMELHLSQADHAFTNQHRPEVYDAAAPRLAWTRTIEFPRSHTA